MMDIPIGTVFTGNVLSFGYSGLFLRTYSSVVLLDEPKHDWHCSLLNEVFINNYVPVNAKIIVSEKKV